MVRRKRASALVSAARVRLRFARDAMRLCEKCAHELEKNPRNMKSAPESLG
jgi:hypothetical protein